LKNLGKKKADDEPISLQKILESNGLLDTIWCFRALPKNIEMQRSISGLALLFVKPIVPLMQDKRLVNTVVVLEKFYLGTANLKELKIATAAASADADSVATFSAAAAAAVSAAVSAAAADAAVAAAATATAADFAATAAAVAAAVAAATAVAVAAASASTISATTAEKKKAKAIQIKILNDWILENNL
jgi:hypothetical protein